MNTSEDNNYKKRSLKILGFIAASIIGLLVFPIYIQPAVEKIPFVYESSTQFQLSVLSWFETAPPVTQATLYKDVQVAQLESQYSLVVEESYESGCRCSNEEICWAKERTIVVNGVKAECCYYWPDSLRRQGGSIVVSGGAYINGARLTPEKIAPSIREASQHP